MTRTRLVMAPASDDLLCDPCSQLTGTRGAIVVTQTPNAQDLPGTCSSCGASGRVRLRVLVRERHHKLRYRAVEETLTPNGLWKKVWECTHLTLSGPGHLTRPLAVRCYKRRKRGQT